MTCVQAFKVGREAKLNRKEGLGQCLEPSCFFGFLVLKHVGDVISLMRRKRAMVVIGSSAPRDPPFFFVGDHFSRAQGSRHVVAELAKKVAGEGPAAACGWLGLGDTTDGEVGLWVPWWLKPPTAHDLLRCNWLFGEIEREVRPRKGPLLVDKEKSRRKIGRRLGGPPGMIHWQQPFSLGPHDWETLGASGWAGCCRYLLLFKD